MDLMSLEYMIGAEDTRRLKGLNARKLFLRVHGVEEWRQAN